MKNSKFKRKLNRAYICHFLLAVGVSLVLAMQIHLIIIDASGEVIGAGIFLLLAWLALPILALLGAVIIYTYKVRADRKVVLLTSVLFVLVIQWLIEINPAMIISIIIELLYVVLVLVIGVRAFLDIRKEQIS